MSTVQSRDRRHTFYLRAQEMAGISRHPVQDDFYDALEDAVRHVVVHDSLRSLREVARRYRTRFDGDAADRIIASDSYARFVAYYMASTLVNLSDIASHAVAELSYRGLPVGPGTQFGGVE